MKVLSTRRITNDRQHNAFTGACWFKGDLFVGYRQADIHHHDKGSRIIVQRSRDAGVTWDTVAVLRGRGDTRDAHLYTDGCRLYCTCYVERVANSVGFSGCAVTDDGDHWTPFEPYTGDYGNYVLWRPAWHRGRHYCAGYYYPHDRFGVHWFESEDGHHWVDVRPIDDALEDMANECYLEILPDGTATMLMRCESGLKKPKLCFSQFPFEAWDMQQLDVRITGPACWTVDGQVYISGRWDPVDIRIHEQEDHAAHTGIFRIIDGECFLICVLPSGPHPDNSYMGVARRPDNRHRFSLSFYSNAIANEDPKLDQWIKPDIYVADVLYGADFIAELLVSDLVEAHRGIEEATEPDPAAESLKFRPVRIPEDGTPHTPGHNFIDAHHIIASRAGLIYFVKDIEVGPWDLVDVHLGYDGPIKVWWNGQEVFEGPGSSPAVQDTTSLHLESKHGTNRLAVALDTRGGAARGIYARWERTWGS